MYMLQVTVIHYYERPARAQKDTGSLLHLSVLFLATPIA